MIEKLLKLASEGNPQAEYLNEALETVKNTPFAKDLINEQRQTLEEAENMMPKLASSLGMSLSELDQFLDSELEKQASAASDAVPLLRRSSLGGYAARGALGIGGAALGGIATSLLNDLYNKAKLSVTEKGNFETMMKNNPDLHDYPVDKVKSVFNTVHRLGGSELSGDPNVAGTIVRNHVMLGDFNKGVDMKSMNELIGARSNLSRGSQVISGHDLPGLDIYKSELDHSRNRLQEKQLEHGIKKDNKEDSRRDAEDVRRTTEHNWASSDRDQRNALDLARHKREEADELRKRRDADRRDAMHRQESRYKYIQTPPNRAKNKHNDDEENQ